ncbi:nuclear transport factor 2 family protein [Mycolicibacterium confluentis]|uniref:Uncharacterized protein n=1 Tax=Mycolicibacterium confluentis TaxID=28047 RepID=A0A7I7Y3I5_9MYCO|nr:nuclear transport factor 2 family protein [Mycolicibacterium confluentis]MCV7320611.1 nuclear transport factor 2 family protein [Mycolicibacterium confluentis]ORV30261.1 hypothetical protein AWB99_14265 [Mycolicibacterium confluentis]BBZ35653.1 hypothetical protein MCNF_42580 [Mycolicibacterium confluentis]
MSQPTVTADKVAQLIARAEITDVLLAYCQAVDRRDWQQVLECYHGDALDHHGPFDGTPQELVAWLDENHRHVMACMHRLSNVSIDITDDNQFARVESYCISYKTITSAAHDPWLNGAEDNGLYRRTVACRYVDTFENRADIGWRIFDRTVVLEWMRREDSDQYIPIDPEMPSSRRDRTDLLYAQPVTTR